MNISLKFAAAAALALPAVAGAQTRTALTLAAGPSIPIQTFRNTQDRGFGLTVGAIRGSDDSPFGLRLNFDYERFPGRMVNGIRSADRRVLGGAGDVMFSTSGFLFRPYFFAGAGAFKVTSKPAGPDAKVRFGFDFGAGVTRPLGNSAIFIESRINSVSQHHAKPLRYVPILFGFLF